MVKLYLLMMVFIRCWQLRYDDEHTSTSLIHEDYRYDPNNKFSLLYEGEIDEEELLTKGECGMAGK